MSRRICVIPGDGIGREVVPAAVEVLRRLLPDLQVEAAEAGWDCFQRHRTSVPDTTYDRLRACGAGLFGAVSSPSHKVEGYRSAILSLRQALALNLNLRPVRSRPFVSPRAGIDLLILRENSEGLYSGREHWEAEGVAIAERVISRTACARLAAGAAELARLRNARRITLVHKANVLPLTCGLFRDTCRDRLAEDGWSDVLDERLVDVAALQLVERPESFDLIVTTNLFGDILSDLASHWGGGLGLAPSLNLGRRHCPRRTRPRQRPGHRRHWPRQPARGHSQCRHVAAASLAVTGIGGLHRWGGGCIPAGGGECGFRGRDDASDRAGGGGAVGLIERSCRSP